MDRVNGKDDVVRPILCRCNFEKAISWITFQDDFANRFLFDLILVNVCKNVYTMPRLYQKVYIKSFCVKGLAVQFWLAGRGCGRGAAEFCPRGWRSTLAAEGQPISTSGAGGWLWRPRGSRDQHLGLTVESGETSGPNFLPTISHPE